MADLTPMRVIVWSFGVAAVCMNLFAPLTGLDRELLDDQASMLGALAHLHAPVWALLAWIVLVGTLAPFGLFLLALTRASATTVTTVAMLEPIGVTALGWAVVRRDPRRGGGDRLLRRRGRDRHRPVGTRAARRGGAAGDHLTT